MVWKEQSRVHDMQRQFEQFDSIQRLIHLACSCPIPNRFVITNSGVIIDSYFLQNRGGLFVEIQPMHSCSDVSDSSNLMDFLQLCPPLDTVMPRVDGM